MRASGQPGCMLRAYVGLGSAGRCGPRGSLAVCCGPMLASGQLADAGLGAAWLYVASLCWPRVSWPMRASGQPGYMLRAYVGLGSAGRCGPRGSLAICCEPMLASGQLADTCSACSDTCCGLG